MVALCHSQQLSAYDLVSLAGYDLTS